MGAQRVDPFTHELPAIFSKGMSSKRNENVKRKVKRAGKRKSQWFKSKGTVLFRSRATCTCTFSL